MVKLGEPDHRERVRIALELQDLQHAVPQVRHRVVLTGLFAERISVHLGQPYTARELHQPPARGVWVLRGEQPGPVAGQLRLAEPLLEPEDDCPQAEVSERHPRDPRREQEQDQQHGAVDRVPRQHMAELVPDHPPELFRVGQVDHPGADHQERLLAQSQGHSVRHRVLDDEDLGHLRQVEDVAAVPDQLVDVRELALGHLDAASQEREPESPFGE